MRCASPNSNWPRRYTWISLPFPNWSGARTCTSARWSGSSRPWEAGLRFGRCFLQARCGLRSLKRSRAESLKDADKKDIRKTVEDCQPTNQAGEAFACGRRHHLGAEGKRRVRSGRDLVAGTDGQGPRALRSSARQNRNGCTVWAVEFLCFQKELHWGPYIMSGFCGAVRDALGLHRPGGLSYTLMAEPVLAR